MQTLRSPIYLLVVLAQVNQAAQLAGLATFMAKFIERQFSQTVSFSTMMIGESAHGSVEFIFRNVHESIILATDGAVVSKWGCLYLPRESSDQMKFKCISLRSSLYPAVGAGYSPGWSSDAKVESFGKRCQQVVHRRHLAQYAHRHAAVAHWLLHPEGWRDLSSQVATPSVYMHQVQRLQRPGEPFHHWQGTNFKMIM